MQGWIHAGELASLSEVSEALEIGKIEETTYDLKLDYSLLSCEEVLKVNILPLLIASIKMHLKHFQLTTCTLT